jgi:hypothetical protein
MKDAEGVSSVLWNTGAANGSVSALAASFCSATSSAGTASGMGKPKSTGRGLPSHVERELRGLLGLRHPRLRIPAGALR